MITMMIMTCHDHHDWPWLAIMIMTCYLTTKPTSNIYKITSQKGGNKKRVFSHTFWGCVDVFLPKRLLDDSLRCACVLIVAHILLALPWQMLETLKCHDICLDMICYGSSAKLATTRTSTTCENHLKNIRKPWIFESGTFGAVVNFIAWVAELCHGNTVGMGLLVCLQSRGRRIRLA